MANASKYKLLLLYFKLCTALIKSHHLVGVNGELNYSGALGLISGTQVSSRARYDQSNKLQPCWDAA